MLLKPDNWSELQHYKDRNPPWIKLHKKTLNNSAFMKMPIASIALAPLLWLLASEQPDGVFDASVEELSFRLHFPEHVIKEALKPLIERKFFVVVSGDASALLAECTQHATPETETETETERDTDTEKEKKVYAPSKIEVADNVTVKKDTNHEKAKRNTTSPFPHGEQCPDEWANWASRNTSLTQPEIDQQYAIARDWANANGKRQADWLAFFRNWCRRAEQSRGSSTNKQKATGAAAVFARVVASAEARQRNEVLGGDDNETNPQTF